MKLTTEQKLKLCIDFIKKISDTNIPRVDPDDIFGVRVSGECPDCGCDDMTDVNIDIKCNADLVDASYIDELKDDAWHVLAEIAD